MIELVWQVGFPLIHSFWILPFVKNPTKREILEFGVLGISLSIIIYTIVGILPLNFNELARSFFAIQFSLFLLGIKKVTNSVRHLRLRKVPIICFVVMAKILLLCLLRPIIDPDVVNSYLPFAQSTYLMSHIPHDSIPTNEPIVIPPPGGWILYSVAMSLTKDINTEIFRLFPFLFFIYFLGLGFYMLKDSFGEKLAIVSSIVFVCLPFVDEFVMTYALYPELIFSAFFVYLYTKLSKPLTFAVSLQAGVTMAASVLTKFQGIFYIPIFFYWVISRHLTFKKRLLFLLTGVSIFYILTQRYSVLLSANFPIIAKWAITFLSFYIVILGIFTKYNNSDKWTLKTFTKLTVMLIVTSIGFAWFARNLTVFKVPFSDARQETVVVHNVSNAVSRGELVPAKNSPPPGIKPKIDPLFFLKSFGGVLFVPKIIGLASILLLLPIPGIILISSMWFWVWSLFMGTVAPSRYLIPLIPVVSLSVGFGITKIASKLKVSSNHLALILGMFSLSQSLFLSWHIGVFMLGYPKVKQLSAASLTSTQSIKEEGKMNLYSSIIALNSTDNNYFKYKAETIAISVAVFAISIAFVKVIAKFKYRDATFALIAIASLLPYAYVIFKVSEGHPIKFAKYEQEKIYNYWGLVNHVMPAINQRSVPNAKIVIYGPHVPVSYKLGLESINIDSGFGIKKLAPILFEKDQIAALQFLKQNKFDFFLLDAHTESVIKFEKLKSTFPVFSIFENPIYFEKIITPTTETAWFLYIIRQ